MDSRERLGIFCFYDKECIHIEESPGTGEIKRNYCKRCLWGGKESGNFLNV